MVPNQPDPRSAPNPSASPCCGFPTLRAATPKSEAPRQMPPVPGRGGPKQSIPFLECGNAPKKNNGFQIYPMSKTSGASYKFLQKGFWIGFMTSVGVSPQMQLQVDHVGWKCGPGMEPTYFPHPNIQIKGLMGS